MSGVLFFVLPNRTDRRRYEDYRRTRMGMRVFAGSGVVMLGQLVLVPVGFAIYKTLGVGKCATNGGAWLYEVAYFVVLIQGMVFCVLALPVLVLPCWLVMIEVPEHHGVSRRRMRRIPTIVYDGPNPDEEEQEDVVDLERGDAAEEKGKGRVGTDVEMTTIDHREYLDSDPAAHSQSTAAAAAETPSTPPLPPPPPKPTTSSLQNTSCPICLEPWTSGSKIKKIKCGHEFCKQCLGDWFEEHND
ncbi:hypothetical protein HDV05_003029, partial [Chytridiales sp. JEL 0842]